MLCWEQVCAIAYFGITIITGEKHTTLKEPISKNNFMDSTKTLTLEGLHVAFMYLSPKTSLTCIS